MWRGLNRRYLVIRNYEKKNHFDQEQSSAVFSTESTKWVSEFFFCNRPSVLSDIAFQNLVSWIWKKANVTGLFINNVLYFTEEFC